MTARCTMSACDRSAFCLRRRLLGALLLLAATQPSCADCPKSCVCHIPAEVHCTFRYLTAVPDHFPPAVERINLGYNGLTFLRESDFLRLEKLQLLMLHSNTIHSMDDSPFRDLRSLQVLKMSHNKIKELRKETFKGLNSLLRLHIDHNQIEFINPEAFYGLTNLQLVQLEGNQLQQLHADTFITLRHSQVFKVSSLKTIHLSDNLLSTLPADIFLGCSQLENLFLHGNQWRCDCQMKWFSEWTQRNSGVLKCKRDRQGQLCPVCETPALHHGQPVFILHRDAFVCTKPWIKSHLKQKNISLEEGDFIPVYPKDFIAPLGSIQMNLTDQSYQDASLTCTVQMPNAFENLTQTATEDEGRVVTGLTTGITTYLVCNVDHEHVQQLWQILATYSDSPMRLERGVMLARTPEMIYRYSQAKSGEEGITTNIKADIKATPAWLMQGEVSLQLDRTTTTFSTLHIKYQSIVSLQLEAIPTKRGRYSWTMIKRDNQTKTEHIVIAGGVAKLSCHIQGDPKPLMEWILPDGSKVRAPFYSEDRRIVISADGVLTLRGADASDTGLYRCIATNYLDADVLTFRVTVLSPDVEEAGVNGLQLSKSIDDKLTLDCSYTGSPRGSVSWILPDHSVLDKSQANRKVYENGTLLIQGLTARDRGFYRCLVANHLGIDLLVSQVTLSAERFEGMTDLKSEGSGMAMDSKMNSSLEDHTVKLKENAFSAPSEKTSQESRTVTSDRPYPRLRLEGRGSPHGRMGQRRRGAAHNRRIWSSRVFAQASRKIDPQKFAELMEKAHDGSKVNTSTVNESVKNKNPHTVYIAEEETGSGGGYKEEHLIVAPWKVKPTTETMETYKPIKPVYTHIPSQFRITEFYPLERTSVPSPDLNPVTLQLSRRDDKQVTHPSILEQPTAKMETSTGAALALTTDPNVTPAMDDPDPLELVLHTDPKSQMTFTAITTTEREKDKITFHTTQTIKSPQLPAGSTIISKQQIKIIPHKSNRGKGGRRTLHGRRRLIKPNRITDIQAFITRFKQPSVKKEENTTDCDCDENRKTGTTNAQPVTPTLSSSSFLSKRERPTSTQKTATSVTNHYNANTPVVHAQSGSEVSSDYITSAEAPEMYSTICPKEEQQISTTKTTTTKSKVIHGKIPWNRLFESSERVKLLGKLKKPFVQPKTTVQTTSVTTLPTDETTTMTIPQGILWSLSPSKSANGKESSLDDDEGLTSGDFEFTTLGTEYYPTKTSAFDYSRSLDTAQTPTEIQTLPAPPTVDQHSVDNPDRVLTSGSGGSSNQLASNRRFGGRRRQQGRRKKPFGGRRLFKRPKFTKVISKTNVVSTGEVTTKKNANDETTQSVSFYSPAYTISNPHHTTTLMPRTTKQPYVTVQNRVSNVRPPIQRNNGDTSRQSPHRTIEPIENSSNAKGKAEKGLALDIMTTFTSEEDNNVLSKDKKVTYNSIPGAPNHFMDNEATTARTVPLNPTAKPTRSKPRIVGGNAASFTVLSNSDAFLPCKAVGNPPPVTTWKHFSSFTGNTISISEKTGRFEVLSNGTLTIQNANIKDRGQYLCLAENDLGSDKLLVTLSVVAYPSRILEPKMREIKSQTGDRVEMKCKAEGRPLPMISWILANRTQVRGENMDRGRVLVSSEGTLIIDHVSIYDRGYYKCIASNPAGADTATVRLQVVAAPPGIVEQKRQQLKARWRQNLWLPCSSYGTPHPSIHWVLHDGSVVRSHQRMSEKRISVLANGTLFIKDVNAEDDGKYECIATSSTGSERRVVTLSVEKQEHPPEIVETSPNTTELSFGDQLRLDCSATGEPKPKILWRLPSKAVVDQWHRMNSRIQVLVNGTLVVNTVSDKDAGDYLCVAQSPIGDALQLMRVTVSMKPAKIEPKFNRKKQVHYGKDLRVDCKASGAPKPEISWGLPDGTMVNSALQADAGHGGGRARRYTLFENGTLFLNQVSTSEEGDYTCYAENQVGKDEMHVHITVVTAAPRIRPPSQTYARVKPGGNIRFDCETFGEPKPKILWRLSNNDVIAASNERYLIHANGSLGIRDVTLIDAGEYVCMARNPVGENRRIYKLDIDGDPPVINGYQQNRTVIKDVAIKHSRKLLDCKAEGDPTPTVTWIMPDNIFLSAPYFGSRINVHHNGTLEIRNVRPSDSAEFICLARNDGGEAVMVVQLEVTSVLRRPIFKNPFNERIMSRIGKTTILNCSADGQPRPEIIWTLPNGTRITSGSRHSSRLRPGEDGTLVIYSSREEDSGKYRCGARNFVGYIEKLIILNIGQKPYIFTRPKGVIRSISGEPLYLHCLSDGSPRPRIYWTIPGGHTFSQPQILGRYHLLENGTLVVRDTTVHDKGNYICRARNNAGEALITVPVLVIAYPPQITMGSPPRLTAIIGTPLKLNCIATGIPKPEITWELPDHSVLSTAEQGRPMGSELLHPQGTLVIQRPSSSDSGQYKCSAKNYLGTDSKVTFVLVL
ncbi:immunoglobulin superfamily member 10 isoform X1 [Xiphophorus hellerii]|uniref:immunoglobulin superfamily member 10 isoform X1 n=2 Tax=Xiphophorus hellerii TaxID=8084 RepID=UPI0013B3CB00|nr:immunoglobulin superfamily member 10 isoform X1 [Xiphophorus hellerii]XP_032401485.1 immunoglobulin superfamily member 10 isoform X1 [Xiphophorus hellerii]